MANEPACPQAPGSETTGHRWGFDKSRSLWTSRRLGVVFGEEAAAGIPASPIPQQACPIVMCRIVGSQHREQARRCTISSLLPRCSRPTDLDPLIVKEGMRTHQPSVSRSRRDTPSVGATSSSARVSAEVSIPPHGRFGSVGLNGGNRRILPVSARPGEGHLAEPIADVQPARREPLFMPPKQTPTLTMTIGDVGCRLCKNVHEPRVRRIVFSIASS